MKQSKHIRSISKSIVLLCSIVMILLCSSFTYGQIACQKTNGKCGGNCNVPLFNASGTQVTTASCRESGVKGNNDCICVAYTNDNACQEKTTNGKKECVSNGSCQTLYRTNDQQQPVTGTCVERKDKSCNCEYIIN